MDAFKPHFSIFKEGRPLEDYIAVCSEACCRERPDWKSYHCRICPVEVFKPGSRQAITRHLSSHKEHAGIAGGFIINRCKSSCHLRPHYHCPYCPILRTRKDRMLTHVDKCQTPDYGSLQGTMPLSRTDSATTDRKPVRPPKSASLSQTTNQDENTLNNLSTLANAATTSVPMDVSQSALEGSKENVVCSICGHQFSARYIAEHYKRKHKGKPKKAISSSRHHFAVCVESANGLYAVARCWKGILVPVHVYRNTSGTEIITDCELDKCMQPQIESALPSGVVGCWCDHVASTCHSVPGQELCVSEVPLYEMQEKQLLSPSRAADCVALVNAAVLEARPAVVSLPNEPSTSQRYKFYSVYTGEVHPWCKIKRVVVMFDTVKDSATCRCTSHSKHDCPHIALVQWALFEAEIVQGTTLSQEVTMDHMTIEEQVGLDVAGESFEVAPPLANHEEENDADQPYHVVGVLPSVDLCYHCGRDPRPPSQLENSTSYIVVETSKDGEWTAALPSETSVQPQEPELVLTEEGSLEQLC